MHAFLKRQYKKARRGKEKEETRTGCGGVLKYREAVSKSMDSLLLVVSSVPLPVDAKLATPIVNRLNHHQLHDRRRTEPKTSIEDALNHDLAPSFKRRHSYDLASGKVSDDEDEEDDEEEEEGSDTDVLSRSSGTSSNRVSGSGLWEWSTGGRSGRSFQRPFLRSLGPSSSFTSDSDDDRSYLSVQTADSQALLMSEEHNNHHHRDPYSPRQNVLPQLTAGREPSHARPAKQDTSLRQRQNVLMEHPFFLLDVRLQEGKDLVVRDSCGTSDPYVKFKVGGKMVYKSRIIFKNLNPKWEEAFTIPIEDVSKPVQIKVLDYDRGLHDDPMGSTEIDVSQLELGKNNDLQLLLSDRGKTDYMGYLVLSCTLLPKTQEDKDQYLRHTVRTTDGKKPKIQSWSGVITIVLVEGFDLVPMDDNGLSDPYVKFKLGSEKYRSKHKSKTLSPRWLEQFDLRMYNESTPHQLEISVFDHDTRGRDDFMGRATIDVGNLESEMTHHLDIELEDGAGLLKLLLTISGTCTSDAQSDLSNYTPDARERDKLNRKYKLLKLTDVSDVGHLQVKVFKANGLKSADLGGQSDPFCVVELVNTRVQTHTEYKTLNPEWNKVFSLKVRDIHSVLEITVFDEDRDKKVEFLGKVAIPLLKIRNGERRWYALKDKKLNRRTKGTILLEMDLVFNHIKAAIRTVNPAEEKFMQVDPKFKIHLMKQNIDRVGQLISIFLETGKFLQSCFSWESSARSATAFLVFVVIVWNLEVYMLPITLLLIFLKNLVIAQVVGAFKREPVEEEYFDDDEDDEDEEKEKEEKKSFKEKLQSIQDVCLQVQQGMDKVASFGERIKNTFNWTVPWLSALAVVVLSLAVLVLYFIPVRWLILAWGINKFTKKLRKPNAISNNELLDFLSRVPLDREVAQYREFRPDQSPGQGKKKRS